MNLDETHPKGQFLWFESFPPGPHAAPGVQACLLAPCSCPPAALHRDGGPLPASEHQDALRFPEVDREQSWGLALPCPVLSRPACYGGAGAGRSLATWLVAPEWPGPAPGRPLVPAPGPQVPPRPVQAPPTGPPTPDRGLLESSVRHSLCVSFVPFIGCPHPPGLVKSRPHGWVWFLAAGGCELCLWRGGRRLAESAQPEQQCQAGVKCARAAAGPRLPAHLGGAHLGLQAARLQQGPGGRL